MTNAIVHAKSWTTLTVEVKISPIYPPKKVGDVMGVVTTNQICFHMGTRVRSGKINCQMVYKTSIKGKTPAGKVPGMS